MKLCCAPGARTLSVHIAMCEIGAKLDIAVVDRAMQTAADGADVLAVPLTPHQHLEAYLERVSRRERVQHASRAEGPVK